MTIRRRLPFFTATLLCTLATTAMAQIPPGWAVSAHVGTPTGGGLFLHDITGALPSIQVTGLPVTLTGIVSAGNNGANAVGILADRTVVVGTVSNFGALIELHHLSISVDAAMTTATATTVQAPILLGAGTGGLRAQVSEIDVINPTTVVVSVSTLGGTVIGGPGPLAGEFAGVVDLATRAVTPVTMSPMPAGIANAVASDGVDVWIGMGTTFGIWKVPIGGGTPVKIYDPFVQCNNLELDRLGNLVVTLGARYDTINALTGALVTSCSLAGGNAMAIDPKTQDWILVNLQRIEKIGAGCSSHTILSPTPPGGWGNASAIALSTPGIFTTFGTGCAGSVGVPTLAAAGGSLPYIGHNFNMQLAGLPPGAANIPFVVLGLSKTQWGQIPLPLDLSPFGIWNCQLYVSADVTGVLTNNGGTALWSLPIPNNPFLVGLPIYVQGAVVDPGAPNPAKIIVTNAGEAILGAF